jgi:hypothetical protein
MGADSQRDSSFFKKTGKNRAFLPVSIVWIWIELVFELFHRILDFLCGALIQCVIDFFSDARFGVRLFAARKRSSEGEESETEGGNIEGFHRVWFCRITDVLCTKSIVCTHRATSIQ